MGRLQESLYATEGELDYALTGGFDEYGKPSLRLVIEGALQLKCQRCLGRLDYKIAYDAHLLLVSNVAEFGPLEEEEMASDRILAQAALNVAALVEEEILLGIPVSPRHKEGECGLAGGLPQAKKPSPFAALAALKKKHPG